VILLWHGAIVDIPDEWRLCDGTGGTPDLQDRFIVGAGDSHAPDDVGGAVNHEHDFVGNGHAHGTLGIITIVGSGPNSAWNGTPPTQTTTTNVSTGTTDETDGRPPFYALAYIMKVSE